MSKRESILNSQLPSQAEYLDQFDSHHGWMDSQQNIQERQTMNPCQLRSFGDGALSNLPNLPSTLDSFTADMAMSPSQISYNHGYASAKSIFKP